MAKMLIDGVLADKPTAGDGKFVRMGSGFRGQISPDPGAEFPAEAGRYHLYVSMACPWSHRTTIMRSLKGLQGIITLTQMVPLVGEKSWRIDTSAFDPGAGVHNDDFLYQVYVRSDSNYTGPITVPVLLDKKTHRIVSNDSADIMRFLNTAFDDVAEPSEDYYPQALQGEIDRISEDLYGPVNNGVYRAGFATSQAAYDEAVAGLFAKLDALDHLLGKQRYLVGDQITEADWRLFTTLIRFDPVYVTHFKTDRKRIADYPNLAPYLRELYQVPGVSDTIDMGPVRQHYFQSHRHINPHGIMSVGPEVDLDLPHHRDTVFPLRAV
ncbi:glutathione S-transferase family protein [Phaeobacter sp. C3_T13_0]|uniref:glutathione S-transferase family protein n=1 Tax=Phaeobacter cretensis TaxID=3342641 RepID=UPI0039BD79A0